VKSEGGGAGVEGCRAEAAAASGLKLR
jgi:hypothetical protein